MDIIVSSAILHTTLTVFLYWRCLEAATYATLIAVLCSVISWLVQARSKFGLFMLISWSIYLYWRPRCLARLTTEPGEGGP